MSAIPTIESYHPTELVTDGTRCLGRRVSTRDRRYTPMVYAAIQCKSIPVATGDGLCATCARHESSQKDWDGRVTGPLPAGSHIVGSAWFIEKAVWTGVERPKTARQEGNLPRAPRVTDNALQHFLRSPNGDGAMDIESLSARNQISRLQLSALVCQLRGVPIRLIEESRAKLCETVRALLAAAADVPPPPPPAPAPAPAEPIQLVSDDEEQEEEGLVSMSADTARAYQRDRYELYAARARITEVEQQLSAWKEALLAENHNLATRIHDLEAANRQRLAQIAGLCA